MISFRTLVSETLNVLDAHVRCAQAGIPLPDKELKNLRVSNDGYRYTYDTPTGIATHDIQGNGKSGAVVHRNKHNQLHRVDGPAVETSKGEKIWVKDGNLVGERTKSGDNIYHSINDKSVSVEKFKTHLESHGYKYEDV